MSWGGPGFVLAIIGMSYGAWIVTTWLRAKHGYPLESEWGSSTHHKEDPDAARHISLLTSENDRLSSQIVRLEERIAVLEKIATDPSRRLADEIENLR